MRYQKEILVGCILQRYALDNKWGLIVLAQHFSFNLSELIAKDRNTFYIDNIGNASCHVYICNYI